MKGHHVFLLEVCVCVCVLEAVMYILIWIYLMKWPSGVNNVHVCLSNNRKENLICPLKVTICCSVIHLHLASSLPWFHVTIHPAGNTFKMHGQRDIWLFFSFFSAVCSYFFMFLLLFFLPTCLFFSPSIVFPLLSSFCVLLHLTVSLSSLSLLMSFFVL